MFVAIYWTGGFSDGALVTYGPFGSEADALAWIAQRPQPACFFVSQIFSPPPLNNATPGYTISPSAGTFVVALATFGPSGASQLFIYGGFTTQAFADAWISQRPFPAGCQSIVIQVAA